MAKKIVLFLSPVRGDAKEFTYSCPDGCTVCGRQTNEAPVKYFLRVHPDIKEILCVVTPQAESSAWVRFQAMAKKENPSLLCTKISFTEEQNFQTDVLPLILSQTASGDEILLETTGGFRDAMMYLLLISRALTYAGVKTIGAVYSNHGQGRIQDVTHLIDQFDLIGGMQELTSFGNVRSLRDFYQKHTAVPEVEEMLDATEQLWGNITLCQTGRITDSMDRFNQALEGVSNCSDPLMRALLPAFRKTFGERLTIPGVIKWCLRNDMIQQALTIYKERIPTYLLQGKGSILQVKKGAPAPETTKEYVSEDEARFFDQFLLMGPHIRRSYYGIDVDTYKGGLKDPFVVTLTYFEKLFDDSYFTTEKVSVARLKDILMDYLYIRAIRNMINHANDQETESQQQLLEYLNDFGYKRLGDLKPADIRKVILKALEHLQPQSKKERAK